MYPKFEVIGSRRPNRGSEDSAGALAARAKGGLMTPGEQGCDWFGAGKSLTEVDRCFNNENLRGALKMPAGELL